VSSFSPLAPLNEPAFKIRSRRALFTEASWMPSLRAIQSGREEPMDHLRTSEPGDEVPVVLDERTEIKEEIKLGASEKITRIGSNK
jgi:hypothetical protein